jgi:hypothetical protein
MKTVFVILAILSSFAIFSQDYNNWHKNYIEVGYTGGSYANTGANVGVFGAAGLFFESFGKQASVDIRGREVYVTSPQRQAGLITLSYRLYANKGLYFGGGFAHNHEVPFSEFLKQPVQSLLGNGEAIIHRSGAVVEAGYDFGSIFRKFGLYPTTNLSVTYMALDKEPNPYVNLTLGLRVGVKKS